MNQLSHANVILGLTEAYLRENRNNILMCEGIDDGFYGTIKGCSDKYKNQCYELPCSENSVVGMAISASTYEITTLVCFQRVEFALLAIEQFANNSSKNLYLSDNKRLNPCLFRFVIGRGWGQGPSHSQSFETMFAQIPDLNVYMPVYPNDSKIIFDIYKSHQTPTISLEHRWIHYSYDTNESLINSSASSYVVKKGKHLTIVSYSYNVLLASCLAEIMRDFGIEIEVINLFCISEIDMKCIYESVEISKLLLIIGSDQKNYSVESQILSNLTIERLSLAQQIKGIKLLTNKGKYSPSSPAQSQYHYVSLTDIAAESCEMLNLNARLTQSVLERAKKVEDQKPHDVPNQSYTGPF